MLVHKINFKVHGCTFKNENDIDIQQGISKILKEYKKNNYFDTYYGGYTKKEIIDMDLNVSEFEDATFSGKLKEDNFENNLCYKIYINTFDDSLFHIGYLPKELIDEVFEWINKKDLKLITNISITGGNCKHCVCNSVDYNDVYSIETDFLNYGFNAELRFCNDEIASSNNDSKFKNFLILDGNTVKIKNKTFTKQQIKSYKNIFLIFSILLIVLGILFIPSLLVGLLTLYMYFYYNKIYKELNK